MRLDVLLKILRTLEGLAAKLTLVRFERDVNADVRGDVVPLYRRRPALVPLASEVQVVGALATDVALAQVVLKRYGVNKCALMPFVLYSFCPSPPKEKLRKMRSGSQRFYI